MKIIKVADYETLSVKTANIIEEILQTVENPVIGLATGSTPERMYAILQEMYRRGQLSFRHAVTFNLDEYVGLSADNPFSYRYYMDTKFFNGIDIDKGNAHVPSGFSVEEEAIAYEEKITAAGQMDVLILGIGLNGHIGFNEPGTAVDSRTHVVDLSASTREVNSRFFNNIDEVPTKAITMGLGTILDAKKIILLVQGEKKADILKRVVHGEITSDVPASFLKLHDDMTIITDIDV